MSQHRALLPMIFLSLCANSLFAQGDRGSITGVVNDSTGAVMPHATVTAVHVSTGIRTTTTTGDAVESQHH